MNKHEEIREIVNGNEANLNKMDMLENLLSGDYMLLAIKQTELSLLNNYITEQEKKDKLLELYREKDNHIENWENYDRSLDMGYIAKLEYLQEQIKALEEALK